MPNTRTKITGFSVDVFANEPHRALLVPEVLLLFFKHLSSGQLVKAAVVCKAWKWKALDILWRTHKVSLSGLLRLMGLLQVHKDGLWYPIPSKNPVDIEVWKLFLDRYSHKVTSLSLDSRLSPSSVPFLQSLLQSYGHALCPNLESICGHDDLPSETATCVLTSTVINVTLVYHSGDPTMHNIFQHLSETCPHIQRFVLRNTSAHLTCEVDMRVFGSLRRVDLTGVSWEAWLRLAECSRLEEACIRELSTPQADDAELGVVFPYLQGLHFDQGLDNSFPSAVFLLAPSMPSLKVLEASWIIDPEERLAMMLGQKSPLLEEVGIKFIGHRITLKTFEGFSTMHNLSSLRISNRNGPTLVSDEAIVILAVSLPLLQVLCIDVEIAHCYRKRSAWPTQQSFVTLNRNCKLLKELELPLELSGDVSLEQPTSDGALLPPSSDTQNTTLTRLTLYHAVLPEDLTPIVRLLEQCYPNVAELGVHLPLRPWLHDETDDLRRAFIKYKERRASCGDV